jgi:hypothetical protein
MQSRAWDKVGVKSHWIKMRKTEDLLALIEEAFLKIKLEVHYDIYRTSNNTYPGDFLMMRARICDDLIQKCRPVIENFLEDIMDRNHD